MEARQKLTDLWQAGVDAVRGDLAVRRYLEQAPIAQPDRILAVGKAATAMAAAALEAFPGTPCLIVTKYHHAKDAPAGAEVIEAAHPVPDANSLKAGAALRAAIAACGPKQHVLMLVSGGASAVAEDLPDGWTLEALASETQRLLSSGADIHEMNVQRREISQIKGGKLLSGARCARVTTLAISDVEGDAIGVIGSGIGDAPESAAFAAQVIASNAHARRAIQGRMESVENAEILYEDLETLAPRLAARLRAGPPGLYVWGGEPTVVLPDAPGKGGRNMALALSLAREMQGAPVDILVAGTDGTDGPTDAAGAFVTGATWGAGASEALAKADAYPWLDRQGALFKPGPTGTNVMDLALVLKHE